MSDRFVILLGKSLRVFGSAVALASLCVVVSLFVVWVSDQMVRPPLQGLENQIVDLAFQVRPHNRSFSLVSTDDVVIIDIDDRSISELGRPQMWPRSYDAGVINHIASGMPLSIGIDFLYTEPDSFSSAYKDMLVSHGFNEAGQILRAMSTDSELANSISGAGNVYLGFFDDESLAPQDSIQGLKFLRPFRALPHEDGVIQKINSPVLPIQEFASGARAVGAIAMPTMQDGMVRNYQLLQELYTVNDTPRFVANFPLYIMLDAFGVPDSDLRFTDYGLKLNEELAIPLRPDGTFRINWLGTADSIRHIPYYKVLSGRIPSEYFVDKFVFMGTSASGLQDLKTVPYCGDKIPGVDVHAIAFLGMMNQAFLDEVSQVEALPFFMLCSLIFVSVFLLIRPLWGFIISLGLIFTELIGFVLWVFPERGLVFPVVTLILLTFLSYLFASLFTYFIREKKSRRLKYAFGSYVSPEVVEQIIRDPTALHLGGEKKILTVLFSDIRGFTAYSEGMDPEEIVALLNDYLSVMSESIFRQKGTIDKFIGDAIMAVFGAPVAQKDHADRACRVGLDMIDTLVQFNRIQMQRGRPPVQIGIGINTGEMTVGNIGSQKRFDYTVIGDAVNLGSRIEGLSKFFGVQIVVAESTVTACSSSEFIFRELGTVQVKGKDLAVRVFELVGRFDPAQGEVGWIKLWNEAMIAYSDRNFARAKGLFQEVLSLKPNDKASEYFFTQCELCLANPHHYSPVLRMEEK